MLLKITTNKPDASALSFLLHKHPDRIQAVDIPAGQAHIFYPKVDDTECTVCLLLDINSIKLVKNCKGNGPSDFALAQYVNDRPYVASSYLSVAMAKAFQSALNGTCRLRPELVDEVMPFTVQLAVLPGPKGGELLIRRLFEPLGYAVALTRHILDRHFSEWGDSRYYTVCLTGNQKLKDLLAHLYVLIPVLDSHKHYWVSQAEVEKLLQKGRGWLETHPEREQITHRYLKGLGDLSRNALKRLTEAEELSEDAESASEDDVKPTLHKQRLLQTLDVLKQSGATRVMDLGCGEGKLLRLLLCDPQFTSILGMDVSSKALKKAADKLHLQDLSPAQKRRVQLIQGSLTYKDRRLEGYDAAALVEVIEHLDLDRLDAFERVVFKNARPQTVILTTPDRGYNQLFPFLEANQFRHPDHRFEWTRAEFTSWVDHVCKDFGYEATIRSVGEEVEQVGAASQMVIFKR